MRDYVVDTIALARYLQDDLPRRADGVFREAEAGRSHLLLPQIALAEFLYVYLKGRAKGQQRTGSVHEVLHHILSSPMFTVTAMSGAAWELLPDLAIPELHDRMIAAEALARKTWVVTNDPGLAQLEGLRTVW